MWLVPDPVIQPGRPVFLLETGHLCRNDLFWAISRAWSANVGTPPLLRPILPVPRRELLHEFLCWRSRLKDRCFATELVRAFRTNYPESLISLELLVVSGFCWALPSTECTDNLPPFRRGALRWELEVYNDRLTEGA